jgi:hypothetical protein
MGEKAVRPEEQSDYQSYLLRLWRVNEGEEGWQASLESPHSGERRGFADLEAMFDFLRRKTAGQPVAHLEEGERSRSQQERERG